jgi:MFS transporter, DHA1 family, tetracycline resistance protein
LNAHALSGALRNVLVSFFKTDKPNQSFQAKIERPVLDPLNSDPKASARASLFSGNRSPAFIFIFITVLLDILSIGIIIPVLPKLVQTLLGGNVLRTAELFGWFISIWALMQFIFSPVMGALSDRFGRRPVVLLSNLALGIDYLIMAFAPTLWVLFIGRIVSGIASATIATAQAYIADITAPENRAGAFGMLGAAFGVGFVLGPALGGVLGHYDLRLPFLVAGGLSIANFCYGYFILPESLPVENRSPFRWAKANPVAAIGLLASNAQLARLGTISFLLQLAHHVLPTVAVLYMGYRYGWEERAVGLVLAFVGVSAMVVQGGLVRPIVARIGERQALLIGLLCGAIGFAIYGYAPIGSLFLIGVPIMAIWGLAQPSISALMSGEVGPDQQGKLQGANAGMMGLSGLIGPWVFALTFAYSIDPAKSLMIPGMPFYVAAAVMFVATVVGFGVRQR